MGAILTTVRFLSGGFEKILRQKWYAAVKEDFESLIDASNKRSRDVNYSATLSRANIYISRHHVPELTYQSELFTAGHLCTAGARIILFLYFFTFLSLLAIFLFLYVSFDV
jgi:hypothetical protein